jgi:hypothetical protein
MFRDRGQEKCFLHAPQCRIERRGLIEIAHDQLNIRAFEVSGFGGIAHERASLLPRCGELPDKFLSVVARCSGDQDHRLPFRLCLFF